MQISSNTIISGHIYDSETGKSFAVVNKMIFDANGRKLFALEISLDILWPTKRYLSWLDITFDDNSLVAESDKIITKEEFPKIAEILKQKAPVLGQKIVDQSDRFLGFASDIIIDAVTGQILQIECKYLLDKRLYGIDDVILIDSKSIRVDIADNVVVISEYEATVE